MTPSFDPSTNPAPLDKFDAELNPDFYNPFTGEPWCKFRKGLFCVNGWQCKNPNHRRYDEDDLDQV